MSHPNLGAGVDLGTIAAIASKAIPADIWDISPILGVVVGHPDSVTVQGLPVPEAFWHEHHTCDVLHMLAGLMETNPPPPPDLDDGEVPLGVLCCAEGHSSEIPPGTSAEAVKAFEEWCETHSLADHPWGRECRNTVIVGFDGSLHTVVHIRDSGKHEPESFEHYDDWPSGCLIDALREFAIAVKAAIQ